MNQRILIMSSHGSLLFLVGMVEKRQPLSQPVPEFQSFSCFFLKLGKFDQMQRHVVCQQQFRMILISQSETEMEIIIFRIFVIIEKMDADHGHEFSVILSGCELVCG